MTAGDRPPFPFPGAWLYCGTDPTVHQVGVDKQPQTGGLRLEHCAFSAIELKDFLARAGARGGIPYDGRKVQGAEGVQINIRDPDGNHIHIDFFGAETEGVVFREVDPSAMNTR